MTNPNDTTQRQTLRDIKNILAKYPENELDKPVMFCTASGEGLSWLSAYPIYSGSLYIIDIG